jgi:hypothetical protein
MKKVYESLRNDVLARIEGGAAIESGPLTALVVPFESCQASWPLLIELLGPGEVRRLRARAPMKVSRHLRVMPTTPAQE